MADEKHKLVVTYKYFDADFGQQWYTATWEPTVTCQILEQHLPWVNSEIKKRQRHGSNITIQSVVCDGVTVYNKPTHTWV